MSTAMPQVPPRPARTQDQSTGSGPSLGSELPKIPPRPTRRLDRSISPQRESFARSPLNETPFLANHGNQSKSNVYNNTSANASSSDLPPRPSSVALPSIGQEGSEYAEVFAVPEELGTSPEQTRNIANDLKLHAPKPSLPTSSAKQRVSAVTRTDSGQAAAFGIGRASSDDKDPSSRPLKAKASFASQTSNGTERPPSSVESEHGIPQIGQVVPMYPNAGDVQAPSPSPFSQPYAPGIGFHNDGTKPRHHGRRTSGRGYDMPPDAYGRFGHGQLSHDRFEKAYYEKHPELFKKELGQYGEGRPEWALSSDDLNKIVRDTASRGAGVGASSTIMGTPTEQIGFQASEEYTSRMSSPRPQSGLHLTQSHTSDTHVDSPLRKESFPADGPGKSEFEKSISKSLRAPSDAALESEIEDEDVIHVDPPSHRVSKIYGGAGHMESTEDLGPGCEDNGIHDEHGYGAPILASDEVAKEPFGWELQPAVSPLNERRSSAYEESTYHTRSGSASSLAGSRPTSRPGSIHGNLPGFHLPSSTPLENLDEYEPLFPEDEKKAASTSKPLTAADKLKRPELKNRKFPSQDIWEDTPNSLQYTATVSTPQLPEEAEELKEFKPKEGETPERAFARRQEELAEKESKDPESFLHKERKQPWAQNPHLAAETRPGLKQRFPSRDIWEDTPDSLQLQTTVATPQSDEKDIMSPTEDGPATEIISPTKPQIPARPAKSKLSESPEKSHPMIPERPSRGVRQAPQVDSTSPLVPAKAKPQVPARPSKPIKRESTENIPLTTVPSNSSAKSIVSDQGAAPVIKQKPPVPSRPVGSKIAALQGGFMSDLNKRLQLGPQAPKKEEAPEEPVEEKEKTPLVDARKSRARGPTRRAPAKSPAPASATLTEKPSNLVFSVPSTLWQIDPDEDLLNVTSHQVEVEFPLNTKAAQSETPTLATTSVEQALRHSSEIASGAEKVSSPPSAAEDLHAQQNEEVEMTAEAVDSFRNNHEQEPVKASDEAPVISQTTLAPPETEEEDLTASTTTLKPSTEDVE